MFFRSKNKNAQDISINEPIDTDKDGNTLTLIDTMATEDHIIGDLDVKLKSNNCGGFMLCTDAEGTDNYYAAVWIAWRKAVGAT